MGSVLLMGLGWFSHREPSSLLRFLVSSFPFPLSMTLYSRGQVLKLDRLVPSKSHEPLHPFLPFSTLTYPVSHGCTSKGTYASSAMFIRYDSIPINRMNGESVYRDEDDRSNSGREFLFFGDVESEYRKEGEEGEMLEQGRQAGVLNRAIWEVAAKSWVDGRLAGIFVRIHLFYRCVWMKEEKVEKADGQIECSYDSARSIHMMFGHMSPPGVYHELKTMASFISSEPYVSFLILVPRPSFPLFWSAFPVCCFPFPVSRFPFPVSQFPCPSPRTIPFPLFPAEKKQERGPGRLKSMDNTYQTVACTTSFGKGSEGDHHAGVEGFRGDGGIGGHVH